MMGNLDFNANNYEPSAPMEVVPSGNYPVRISATEIKQTKSGTGKYLQLTLDIVDGQYRNRKLFDRLNLWNPNSQAVDIANKTLSAICHATGIMQPRNHEELRGKTLMAKVTVDHNPQYGDKNEVKGYSAMEGDVPQQVSQQNAYASASQPNSNGAPPADAAPKTAPWGR
jgi:Protein of unknown function (DUF669)